MKGLNNAQLSAYLEAIAKLIEQANANTKQAAAIVRDAKPTK